MDMAHKVTCVDKDTSFSAPDDCRCIQQIGYENGIGTTTDTPRSIHNQINAGTDFYVESQTGKTYLEAATRGTTKYVRTESNDTSNDNLLQQPSC